MWLRDFMGVAIVKLSITEYTQSIEAHQEMLPEIVIIGLLQFHFKIISKTENSLEHGCKKGQFGMSTKRIKWSNRHKTKWPNVNGSNDKGQNTGWVKKTKQNKTTKTKQNKTKKQKQQH